MSNKTTYILFGALVALVAVLLFTLRRQRPDEGRADRLFTTPSGDPRTATNDDITKVVIQRKRPQGQDIVLERDGDSWKITSPRSSPAETSSVSGLIRSILDARTDEEYKPESPKKAGL